MLFRKAVEWRKLEENPADNVIFTINYINSQIIFEI